MTDVNELTAKITPDLRLLCDSDEITAERYAALHRITAQLTPPNLLAVFDALAQRDAQIAALTAENGIKQEFIVTCFRSAASGADMDGADIQELGENLGLFARETYQPVLHGYICGHEAGEDSVYVLKDSPATHAVANALRAEGAIAARNALIAAENGADIYATVTAVIDQLRGGKA